MTLARDMAHMTAAHHNSTRYQLMTGGPRAIESYEQATLCSMSRGCTGMHRHAQALANIDPTFEKGPVSLSASGPPLNSL